VCRTPTRLGKLKIRIKNPKWDTWQPWQRGIENGQLRQAAAEALVFPPGASISKYEE
jgi:hypothetical protein